MRLAGLAFAVAALGACTDGPSANIVAPLPDTTVVAVVELRLEGYKLTNATTKVYVDLAHYTSDMITNTLPAECDEDCNFVISFAGASIMNGTHSVAAFFFDGEKQIASDAVQLIFAR